MEKVVFGGWEMSCCPEEPVVLSPAQVSGMNQFLNDQWLPWAQNAYRSCYEDNLAASKWGVPSFMVRLDTPPLVNGSSFAAPYEVEGNTAGQGFTASLPGGDDFIERVLQSLEMFGIKSLSYGAAESRRDQLEELAHFMGRLDGAGISVTRIDDLSSDPPEGPLWLRAGEEDVSAIAGVYDRCLLMHRDGGGHKGYLIDLAGARRLSDCQDVFTEFPDGFALKPIGGWGSRGVLLYSALPEHKKAASTRTQAERALEGIRTEGQLESYLAQPYLPPEKHGKKTCRIWRVFANLTPKGYRISGGVWLQRNSAKVHGASDSIVGPIIIDGEWI